MLNDYGKRLGWVLNLPEVLVGVPGDVALGFFEGGGCPVGDLFFPVVLGFV